MKRPDNIVMVITFMTFLFLSIIISCNQNPEKKAIKPNILFIAVDDLKPALGCYGDSLAITPNIDGLAETGTTFILNYCQQAVCAPSRASLLTGRYPDQIRIWDLKTVIREKNPGIVTLPQYFRNHGYITAATGKIFDPRSLEGSWGGPHDSLSWSVPYISPGKLDTYNPDFGPPSFFYAAPEAKKKIAMLREEAKDKGITAYEDINNYIKQHYFPAVECADVPYDAYSDGAMCNHGLRLLDSLSKNKNPFFIAVGFHRPHLPFVSPKKYWDLFDRNQFNIAQFRSQAVNSPGLAYHNSGELRNGYTGIPMEGELPVDMQLELIHGYYAASSYIDDMIGRLLKRLDELDLTDNTIVVLWGDHGWHLGDHGLWCKHTNFEQATRAPLIMRAPYQKTKGGKHYHPTEFTDIAPTLCELAGLPIPDFFEGISLKSLLDDPDKQLRVTALSQYPRHGLKYMGYTIRTERYRYTIWMDQEADKAYASELYDYQIDPLETTSYIKDEQYDPVIQKLDSILIRRIKTPSTKRH